MLLLRIKYCVTVIEFTRMASNDFEHNVSISNVSTMMGLGQEISTLLKLTKILHQFICSLLLGCSVRQHLIILKLKLNSLSGVLLNPALGLKIKLSSVSSPTV